MQCHLESWLAQHREADPDHDPVPWYVERDFRRYLDYGLLCRGFGRAITRYITVTRLVKPRVRQLHRRHLWPS